MDLPKSNSSAKCRRRRHSRCRPWSVFDPASPRSPQNQSSRALMAPQTKMIPMRRHPKKRRWERISMSALALKVNIYFALACDHIVKMRVFVIRECGVYVRFVFLPSGSAGGTSIQKKDSFKNHDPYRFTRSTAYPYK